MDPALTVVLFAAAMSTVTAFVAYWAGVGIAEKRHKAREAVLLDDLDDAIHVLTDMAVHHHPAGRHLRLLTPEGA
jgi:F0F1-type ATP synthase alpha subunit